MTSRFKGLHWVFILFFQWQGYNQDFLEIGRSLNLQSFSIEALKPHAIEDIEIHLCDQLIKFHGMGDLTEDSVEQAQQEGIHEDI